MTVRTALDRAAEKIGDRFAGKPMVEASIRQTVGETYGQLGLFPQAVPHLKRALELRRSCRGGDDPETFLAMKALGALYLEDSKLTEAEPLLLQALDGLRKTRSHDDLRALETAALLGVDYQLAGKTAEAEALLSSTRQALLAARAGRPPDARGEYQPGPGLPGTGTARARRADVDRRAAPRSGRWARTIRSR